jgi:hypothetical protein
MTVENQLMDEAFIDNRFNESYLYSVNRNSFIKQRSSDVFLNYFNNKILLDSTFYLISGCDSGLLIRYILEKSKSDNSRYLFIELEKHIETYMQLFPELKDNSRIRVCTIEQWKNNAAEMNLDAYIYQQSAVFIKSIGAYDLFDFGYHTINLTLESELQEHIFRVNSSLGNHEFIEQQLNNISENIQPTQQLKNVLSGKTCIILAGGPSLDDHMDWVISNRKKLIIIAVSRISKRLLNLDIIPDIVISVDPKHNSFEVSRELLLLPKTTLFIHTNNVHSSLLSQWLGKSAYIGNILPWESKLNQENFSGEGPTVTNTAISLASFMGIKRILLSGVDLCNSQQGMSHALGSIEAEIEGKNLAFIGVNTKTYAGDPAQTTIQMAIAARMLDKQAIEAKLINIEIINLSSSATASEHIKFKPTCDIQLSPHNIELPVSDLVKPTNIKERRLHNQKQLKEIQKLIIDCKEIQNLSKKALEHNELLFDANLSNEKSYEQKLKMDIIEKRFNTKFKTAANFIKEYGIQFFIKCVQLQGTNDWNDDKLKDIGALYYQAYLKSSLLVLKLLNKTKDRLLTRIEELSNQPNISKIITQWKIDQHPGRCYFIYQLQHEGPLTLSHQDKLALKKQEQLFSELISTVTQFKTNLTHISPLKGVKVKIQLLFKQQDVDNLNKLVQGLLVYAEKNEDGAPLYYLAQAYLLTLIKQYEQSLLAFEDIGAEYLEEDELKQIASNALKLQLPELAESALSMLVNINDVYLPQYANILRITGKVEQAIDSYIRYLETYDRDIYNWLELGNLFSKISAKESAEMAFKRVLELDASNQTAKEKLQMLMN